MEKNIFKSLGLVLIGVVLGGAIIYGYYNSRGFQESKKQGEGKNLASCDFDVGENDSAAAYLKFKKIKADFIPSGTPEVYGKELDVSFDKVQDAINKIRVFGPTYGTKDKKIVLAGADLKRYIDIGSQTACQYCCGAKTLVKKDGSAACGCAHSGTMRGLAAYLIKNHSELSDEQILRELNLWKRTFFPKQTLSAELKRLKEAGEPGVEQILKEFPDFLPQMVGGC